jgi:hypothetical protein
MKNISSTRWMHPHVVGVVIGVRAVAGEMVNFLVLGDSISKSLPSSSSARWAWAAFLALYQ